MSIKTRHVKYAFADVVDFTRERTIEAQVEIIQALNAAFRSAVGDLEVIYLPTGDGICVGIVQSDAPADTHLKVALDVIRRMHEWSSDKGGNRACKVRFGINESV